MEKIIQKVIVFLLVITVTTLFGLLFNELAKCNENIKRLETELNIKK